MARNGSGSYSAPASSWNPSVGGTTINTTDWNALLSDISSALTQSLSADGQTTATARIPFVQGVRLGVGSAGSPALNFTGSLTSGFYSPGTDQIGLSVATTPVLTSDGTTLDLLVNTAVTGTLTASGVVTTPASTTGGAGLVIGQGVAPTSPTNGQVWITTAGLYARINGSTQGPYLSSGGSFLSVANNLSDVASASISRTNLGLGTMATQASSAVAITGGTITGITDIAVADGGTGSGTASGARTNLGLVIGTDVQQYNANLAAFAGLSLVADRLPYANGTGTLALATFTAAGRALVDDADATAQRATLGLVIGTNVQAQNANLSALAGLTSGSDLLPYFTGSGTMATTAFTPAARSILDDANVAAMRNTLGLGTIATQAASAVAITGGSVTGITDITVADGGTGASTAAAARTNLGIGTIGTQDAGAVNITGGTIVGISDLAIADGGTGASDAAGARENLLPALGPAGSIMVVNAAETDITYATRALVKFGWDGSSVTVDASSNVASVTRTDVGDYTITFDTAFPSADYVISAIGSRYASGDALISSINRTSGPTASACFITFSIQSGTPDDPRTATVYCEAIL